MRDLKLEEEGIPSEKDPEILEDVEDDELPKELYEEDDLNEKKEEEITFEEDTEVPKEVDE